LEEVDAPKDSDFYALSVEPEASFEAVFNAKLLGGVVTLETALQAGDLTAWKGELYRPLERTRNTASARERATLVPYYGWANRGAGKMRVWLPYTSGRSS
jgi:hypothetical protein